MSVVYKNNKVKIAVITTVVIIIVAVVLILLLNNRPEVIPEPIPTETEESYLRQSSIGSSVENRDIDVYAFGKGNRQIVFVGGIHGGYEWNSTYLAYRLVDYLSENPNVIPDDTTVSIIPSANPDGLFKVTGKEGRFGVEDIPDDESLTVVGRFNANNVDLNRNFDCKWQPESTWRGQTVSAGSRPFSEPESLAIKNFLLETKPDAVVFWHSQANSIFASSCEEKALPETLKIMEAYSMASGYPTSETFDAYEVTGDAGDWLSTIGIPSITVELETHYTISWEKNLAGAKAVIEYRGE